MPQVKIGYGVYNVYQRYWYGQNDPLYAVLSRRGFWMNSVQIEASIEEIKALQRTTEEILEKSQDPSEVYTAKCFQVQLRNEHLWDLEYLNRCECGGEAVAFGQICPNDDCECFCCVDCYNKCVDSYKNLVPQDIDYEDSPDY